MPHVVTFEPNVASCRGRKYQENIAQESTYLMPVERARSQAAKYCIAAILLVATICRSRGSSLSSCVARSTVRCSNTTQTFNISIRCWENGDSEDRADLDRVIT